MGSRQKLVSPVLKSRRDPAVADRVSLLCEGPNKPGGFKRVTAGVTQSLASPVIYSPFVSSLR